MIVDTLTKEFMATGQQPTFKPGFDFCLITQHDQDEEGDIGATLRYFSIEEEPEITKQINIDKTIVLDVSKSVLILLTDVPVENIPNIGVSVAKKQ